MNHYLIFGIGVFVGFLWGLVLAGLCGAVHSGDHDQDLWQAYQDGKTDAQLRPGCTSPNESFGCCGVKPLTEADIDGGRG